MQFWLEIILFLFFLSQIYKLENPKAEYNSLVDKIEPLIKPLKKGKEQDLTVFKNLTDLKETISSIKKIIDKDLVVYAQEKKTMDKIDEAYSKLEKELYIFNRTQAQIEKVEKLETNLLEKGIPTTDITKVMYGNKNIKNPTFESIKSTINKSELSTAEYDLISSVSKLKRFTFDNSKTKNTLIAVFICYLIIRVFFLKLG